MRKWIYFGSGSFSSALKVGHDLHVVAPAGPPEQSGACFCGTPVRLMREDSLKVVVCNSLIIRQFIN